MKKEVLPRRVMLHRALALGCGLCLPIALSGCDANKGSNQASKGSTPASKGSDSTIAAAPQAVKKMAKASVQYQEQPKGEQKCSLCQHFIAESRTCQLVEGEISPEGWCVQWMKKV